MENTSESVDLSESAIVPQDFVPEPAIETKLEDAAVETNEELSREVSEDPIAEPENGTSLEEMELDPKIPENFVVEAVNEKKIEEVIKQDIEEPPTTNESVPEPEVEKNLVDAVLETKREDEKAETRGIKCKANEDDSKSEESEKSEKVENNLVGTVLETKREDEKAETRGIKRKANEDDSKSEESEKSKPENESTPATKKQKLDVELTNPNILKPFDLGWKRELVYRSANGIKKINCDIYYYTPNGKKLRSMREVAENLHDDVTVENFTFAKKPLGLDDPEKEIIRNANTKVGVPKKNTPKPIKKKSTVPAPAVIVTTTPLQKHKMSTREESKSKKTEKIIVKTSTPSTPKLPKLKASSKKRKRMVTFTDNKIKKIKSIQTDNFFEDVAAGYNIFLKVFKYLEVEYLLNASRVCKMWNFMANNQSLWETVRLKNSHLRDWRGMINTLKKNRTIHLDLRKILLPSNANDEFWNEFTARIKKVKTLKKIYLCRCPAQVVEQLCVSNPKLEVISATMINSESMETSRLGILQNLQELHLKAITSFTLTPDLNILTKLTQLKQLSLTSISNLNQLNVNVIGNLINLKSLSLGECVDFPPNFSKDVLSKLQGLEQLRLEKGQGHYYTSEILAEVKNLKHLEQLELINFDLKTGFDRALGECTNIKTLFLIPNYIVQSSLTCNLVLGGVMRLQETLTHFVWGITSELIKITEFLAAEYDSRENEEEKKLNNYRDHIPILKPIPNSENVKEILPIQEEVQIVTLSELRMILLKNIPNTRTKIMKIPFHSTWKQSLQTW